MIIPFKHNDPGAEWAVPNRGDCVLRAVSIAMDWEYLAVGNDLNKKIGGGDYGTEGVSVGITNEYLIEVVRSIHTPLNPPENLEKFIEFYGNSVDSVIFRVELTPFYRHLSVIKDGMVQDDHKWWLEYPDCRVTDLFIPY